jgi:hypothetical protein
VEDTDFAQRSFRRIEEPDRARRKLALALLFNHGKGIGMVLGSCGSTVALNILTRIVPSSPAMPWLLGCQV